MSWLKINVILGVFMAPVLAQAQVQDSAGMAIQIDSLIQLSRKQTGQNLFEDALSNNDQAEGLARAFFGDKSAIYGSTRFNHGRILFFKKDLKAAEPYYLEAVGIRERAMGKENPEYAQYLFNLGTLNQYAGNLEKAETYFLESLQIREKVLGKEHPVYIVNLESLGTLFDIMDKPAKACSIYQEAKLLREKFIGKEDKEYAMVLNQLAQTYSRLSEFDKAIILDQKALLIYSKIVEKSHPLYLGAMNSLANDYFEIGDYREVEKMHLCAMQIQKDLQSTKTQAYAWTLNNLANAYWKLGDFEKAESFHLQAKDLREKILGKFHPDYAVSLQNLANVYYELGNLEKSVALNQEGIHIIEQLRGRQNIHYATLINNLANCYWRMGKLELAEPLHLEAKSIRERLLGNDNLEYSGSLQNLGNLYYDKGEYEKSEQYHLAAIGIKEKMHTQEHPDYPWSLINLANVYVKLGDLDKAESLNLKAISRWEKTLGRDHPFYSTAIENLATMYTEMGEFRKAEPLYKGLYDLNKGLIIRSLRHLSERELNSYLQMFSQVQSRALYAAQASESQKNSYPEICYDNALFYKGLILCAVGKIKSLVNSDSILLQKFNQLQLRENLLARQYSRPVSERDSIKVVDLLEQIDLLQKELAQGTSGYTGAAYQPRWKEVQAALGPGEAAIEFVTYQDYSNNAPGSTKYAALVLISTAEAPLFVPLFEEKRLKLLLRGAAGGDNFMRINELYNNKALYDMVWKPLDALLDGINTVYSAPSGLLYRINLSAIPTPEGQEYGNRRQLVLLNSTRQLVVRNSTESSTNDAWLYGGIRYDTVSTDAIQVHQLPVSDYSEPDVLSLKSNNPGFTRGGMFDYLPNTAKEVDELGKILRDARYNVNVDTGFYASEESFRRLGVEAKSPRVIHVATHGYFFPDPVIDRRKLMDTGNGPIFKRSDQPMIRSGLIMAGASQAWLTGKQPEGREDGILTAYEISQMNLSGTELVVLSACETGLGDIMGNEGVYGLQRAFKIAGVRYLIMSLWKVDDKSTRAFMASFYRHWLMDKQPVPLAFRNAQEEMHNKYSEPYDWAAFILIE